MNLEPTSIPQKRKHFRILVVLAWIVGIVVGVYLFLPKLILRPFFNIGRAPVVFGPPTETTQYSWDTILGRINADKCSGPPHNSYYKPVICPPCTTSDIRKCNPFRNFDSCLDGGTAFTSTFGNATCGSNWERSPLLCQLIFNRLSAKDVIYTTEQKPTCN